MTKPSTPNNDRSFDPDSATPSEYERYNAHRQSKKLTADMKSKEIAKLEQFLSEIGPFPIPSSQLRLHVGRSIFASNFLGQGKSSSSKILEVFGENPSEPVLDWGCGCGRTLWWLSQYPAWREHYRGTDVDTESIAWLKSQDIQCVEVCASDPPHLPYDDNSLSGLFSFSVFTHIPPLSWRPWMKELARVVQPGGQLYLTFNGDSLLQEGADNPNTQEFLEKGWTWIDNPGNFKGAAFASHETAAAQCDDLFQIDQIVRRDYATMDAIFARVT